ITKDGTDIGPEFIQYVQPLIQGEPMRKMEQGLPVYCVRPLGSPLL
ncbi:MAG: 6-phosphofructokinase, partial [Hungatella sp.]